MLVEQLNVHRYSHEINRETIFSGNGVTINDLPSWLPKADFSRTPTDLLVKYENDEIIFINYFFISFLIIINEQKTIIVVPMKKFIEISSLK